jgi:dTDP-4-dehydrorhamnose 3,5-epimerase-like enzyme
MVFGKLAYDARFNDPAFGIEWPIAHAILSEWDASYPGVQR